MPLDLSNLNLTWRVGLSWLQREVERRKVCYQECIVRSAYLHRPGWEKPLYADLEAKYKDDPKTKASKFKDIPEVKERSDHLNDNLIARQSICEAHNYRVQPPKEDTLKEVCDKINRFDQAVAAGMDIGAAIRAYGDLTVKPIVWDGDNKYHGLARLELARRYPERRRQLFNWNPNSANPQEKGPDGYWHELLKSSYDHLHLLWDTADFHANDFLRLLYLYGQTPSHLRGRAGLWRPRDQMDRDPDFSAQAEANMLKALHEFKYWLDEQPRAALAPEQSEFFLTKAVAGVVADVVGATPESPDERAAAKLVAARKAHPKNNKEEDELKYEMSFWSENHQVLFPTAEYLIGQWSPDEVFMPGRAFREGGDDPTKGDFTGQQRMDHARPRILRWLNDRLHFGFSEWNAPGYYKEHLQALFNLADFCLDDDLRQRAHMVMDLLFFDLARFTQQGHFGATAGRAYLEHKNCGWEQGVCDLTEMLFGTHFGIFSGVEPAPGMLASSRVYQVPDAIISIGQDQPERFLDQSRVSLNINEAHEYGITTTREEDIIRWWSRAGWYCKEVIAGTRRYAEQYNLLGTDAFKQLNMTGAVDAPATYIIAALSILLNPPLGVSLLGFLEIIDEEEMADFASLITEGSALTRANLYTWRDRHTMLSSVQRFRVGQYNFQSHTCQATLSMGATVWTTHPSAGANLNNLKDFLEAVGGGVGGVGGGLLGAALGNVVGAVFPLAPLAGAALGAWKGFEAGKEVGGAIGDVKLIPVNHDGPNWWTGSVTLPHVVQVKNAAIIAYNPHPFQLLLFGHRTHAWFPKDAFDQNADADDHADYGPPQAPGPYLPQIDLTLKTPLIPSLTPVPSVHSNVDTGAWIFGRVGDGYVALYSGQPPEWTTEGDWANKEIMADGKRNVFILQVGSKEEFGSYINFKRRVLSARIHINGLHWAPADFECSYDVPNGSRLELHHNEQVRYAGEQFSDDNFPRFENPYAHVAWQQNKYVIQDREHSLTHDLAKGERKFGGAVQTLAHDVNLRIYVQNTGLFPTHLLNVPIPNFPLYKGTERDRALDKLIAVLRDGNFGIVGLTEMWHTPDVERIVRELGHLYPYHLAGPDEADLERFGGGLLLLSRHKMVASQQTIFRDSVGEDSFANKGVFHARIHPQGAPCPVDVFLSHTQGPQPVIGTVAEARAVIRNQIRQLSAFLHSCRDTRFPALLMGDMNVDGLNDQDQYKFLTDHLYETTPGEDLHPALLWPSTAGWHYEATSENEKKRVSSFNQGNSERWPGDSARFQSKAERLDYFFSWPGTIYQAEYPLDERKVVLHQSSPGRDMSDHYGLEARLATITQKLVPRADHIRRITVRSRRFWCLDTTSGPGDDEVEFTLRVTTGTGVQQAVTSTVFEDVSEGTERLIDAAPIECDDPGDFLILDLSGLEMDDFSADDSLGTARLWLTRFELLFLRHATSRRVLPRLTGDGGEYAVEVVIEVQ